MADNKEYFVVEVPDGSVRISEAVIASIAATACLETEGVHCLSTAPQNGDISDIFSKKGVEKGIALKLDESGCHLCIYLLVKLGFSVTEVAKTAQTAVKNALEAMVGIKVAAVNIFVSGVAMQK